MFFDPQGETSDSKGREVRGDTSVQAYVSKPIPAGIGGALKPR